MRGRKPKPTDILRLTGNPGKRSLGNEPEPERCIPAAPEHLDVDALAEWQRVSAELHSLGLLSNIDRSALAAYCMAYSRWKRAEESVSKTGEVLKSAEGGYYQNPYLGVANRAMEQMHKFLIEFGMTPSARARVRTSGAAAKKKGVATRGRTG